MPVNDGSHPDHKLLRKLATGNCSDWEMSAIEQHLNQCDQCSSLFANLSWNEDPLVDQLKRMHEGGKKTNDRLPNDAVQHPNEEDPSVEKPTISEALKELSTVIGQSVDDTDVQGSADANILLQQVGEYQLLNEIARGGMGVVYRARHRTLGRFAAIKLILGAQFASEEQVKRFYSEAEAAAGLDHPGIVPIFEVGKCESQHYLAMAYIDGQSLWQRVKEAPLNSREAAGLIQEVAEAVHYAHTRGIVHRDLKPQNILITSDGHPRVTDFGLAKRIDADSHMTLTGQVMGTPSYMPPEQALGLTEKVGEQSDIYSLGATLYCLLTGRPPFQAASPSETLRQVCESEPVSPRLVNPSIPRDLETICLKCLRKEQINRYVSAQDLAKELERFQVGEPIMARPIGQLERLWRWCRRKPIAAATSLSLAILSMIIAIGIPLWIIREESLRTTMASEQTAIKSLQEETRLRVELDNLTGMLQVSQAYNAWRQGQVASGISLLDRCSSEHRSWDWHYVNRLCNPPEVRFTAENETLWDVSTSCDGRFVAACSGSGHVGVWDLLIDKLHRVIQKSATPVWSIAFSPVEPEILAIGGEGGTIEFYDILTGTNIRTITVAKPRSHVNGLCFSDDGGRMAYCWGDFGKNAVTSPSDAGNGAGICTWQAEVPTIKSVSHDSCIWSVSLSKDETSIAFADFSGRIMVAGVDMSGASIESPRQVCRHASAATSVSLLPDGNSLASAGEDGVVNLVSIKDGNIIRSWQKTGQVKAITVAVDADWIAATGTDSRVTLWRLSDGTLLNEYVGHLSTVSALTLGQDKRSLVTSGHDGRVSVWKPTNQQWRQAKPRHKNQGRDVCAIPNTNVVISQSNNGELVSHDLQTEKSHVLSLSNSGPAIQRIAVDGEGKHLALGKDDGTVAIHQLPPGPVVSSFKAHYKHVTAIAYAHSRPLLATSGDDHLVRIWSLTESGPSMLQEFTCPATDLAFNADGSLIACSVYQGVLVVPIGNDARSTQVFETPAHMVRVAFSSDGRFLAAGGWSGVLRVWRTEDWDLVHATQSNKSVNAIAFSPDNRRMALGEGDFVRILDTATFLPVLEFLPGEMHVNGLAFDFKAHHLVSCQQTGVVLVWKGEPTGSQKRDDTDSQQLNDLKTLEQSRALRRLTVKYNQIGDAKRRAGLFREALAFHERSMVIREKRIQKVPDNSQAQEDLAFVYKKIANLYQKLKQYDNSIQFLEKELPLRRQLAVAKTGDTEIQQDLGSVFNRIAESLNELGRHQEAREYLLEEVAVKRQLATTKPDDATLQRELTLVYCQIGDVELQLGHYSAALDAYREDLAISERLASTVKPESPAQNDLAISWDQIAEVHLRQDNFRDAINCFQKSLTIRQLRARGLPHDAEAHLDVMNSHKSLGNVSRYRFQFHEAAEQYFKGLEVLLAFEMAHGVQQPFEANTKELRDLIAACHHLLDIIVDAEQETNQDAAKAISNLLTRIRALIAYAGAVDDQIPALVHEKWGGPALRSTLLQQAIQTADLIQETAQNQKPGFLGLLDLSRQRAAFLYDSSRGYGLCLKVIDQIDIPDKGSLRSDLSTKSLKALSAAIAAGYREIDHITRDPDLEALRNQTEFIMLIETSKRNASPTKPAPAQ